MPSPRRDGFVTGLVLGAGGSRRLGRPKQLLPYGDTTLLGHVLDIARACPFDQLVVALGGAADGVREQVDLSGAEVVLNEAFGSGCSSSIAAALGAIDERAGFLVLMLGDMPGVTVETVTAVVDAPAQAPLAVCRYDDQRGHPFRFERRMFEELSNLHGDKGVWRLLDQRAGEVVEIPIAGPVPLDVDTPEDYEAVLAAAGFVEARA
jgi:molybdenum cofactor cytidylyltransferase